MLVRFGSRVVQIDEISDVTVGGTVVIQMKNGTTVTLIAQEARIARFYFTTNHNIYDASANMLEGRDS